MVRRGIPAGVDPDEIAARIKNLAPSFREFPMAILTMIVNVQDEAYHVEAILVGVLAGATTSTSRADVHQR